MQPFRGGTTSVSSAALPRRIPFPVFSDHVGVKPDPHQSDHISFVGPALRPKSSSLAVISCPRPM